MSNATCSKIYIGGTDGKAKLIYPTGKTMTARFDLSNSDPATWGEYLDDAANMTAGSAEWDAFFGHYPAMIKNGAIVGELDPSQGYAKYTDGTTADITSGTDGDVMIVFPRRGLKIWQDSGYLYVSMTTEVGKTGYEYYAHTYKGNACDWFALGRYEGYYDGSKLRSLSGKTPTVNQTIGTFRTYAQSGGTGYEQSAFFQLTYRQAMYMLKYCGQNAQSVIGMGYTATANTGVYGATGYTNNKGLDWGESTGTYPMSLFGLEDFYGNLYEWLDGIYSNSNRQLLATDGNYNDTGTNYTTITNATASSNWTGYLRYPIGTTNGGFAPLVSSSDKGSATTYFGDSIAVLAGMNAYCSGNWNAVNIAGVFFLYVLGSASATNANLGSRLMYLHTA